MAKRGNGEGSIYKRKDGRWAASHTLAGGRRKTVYGSTERVVRGRLREVQRLADRGVIDQPARLTVSAVMDTWLTDRRGGLGARTAEEYARVIANHLDPIIGRRRAAQLRPRRCRVAPRGSLRAWTLGGDCAEGACSFEGGSRVG